MKKVFVLLVVLLVWRPFSYSQEKNNNSLLWRIDGRNIDTPSYLFGTIHLPQKKFVNYSDSVYVAIQNTRSIYNELDFLNPGIFGDTTLLSFLLEKKSHLDSMQKTPEWRRMIDVVNKKYNTHLSYDSLDQFLEFGQKIMASTFEPEEGMSLPDVMLATYAMMLGKKTGGLETYQLQFSMVYEILDARLRDTTLQFEDELQLTTGLKRHYIDERTDSIDYIIGKINPVYREIVFDRRNKTMADSIEKHIAEMPSFFAVGAGHLGGSQGVIEWLRKKGFTLTAVHSDNKISMLIINRMMKMLGDTFKENKKDRFKSDIDRIKEDIMKNALKEDQEAFIEPPPPPKNPPKKVEIKKPATTKPKTKNKP